ncbi:hypothetical protein CK203_109867 [Vitis vinifera]|uniref:HAT C-terminal dimerisation domain-containing protein n=1 Tax=Vitis vinifera TaxID=29760 RepID=A0A438E547_VITVI|nr:hypothetical protein CK203_109867 [Vitis vinifera]
MKQAMKESRRIFEEGRQEHQKGGNSSQPSNARIKRGLTRSFSVREGASIHLKGIDPYKFSSKHKSIKNLFSTKGMKKVAHCIDLMLEDITSMKQIKETLDQAKMITRFIYNSLKVVNLMKVFTKDRDLLRLGITRFANEFISLESLIRYKTDLKRMCTTNEWREFNKDRSKKSLRDKVSNLILTDRFWKKVVEVQTIMEPLVKASIKQWEKYWEVIDRRWEGQLHRHLHAVKLFVDGQGEFGSALTKKAINQSLPAEWWNNYGDEGPHLQKIAIQILSQTCSSSGLPTNEEGRETVHEDDGSTNRRVSRHTSNATQERDVDSCCKGKAPRTISSSSSSDDGDNGGSRRGGGTSGGSRGVSGTGEGTGRDGSIGDGYVTQVDRGMSWA